MRQQPSDGVGGCTDTPGKCLTENMNYLTGVSGVGALIVKRTLGGGHGDEILSGRIRKSDNCLTDTGVCGSKGLSFYCLTKARSFSSCSRCESDV